MTTTKRFHIRDIISVTDGRLICEDGMLGIYRIMGWVTGDDGITTIGLAVMADKVKAELEAQFPGISAIRFPEDADLTTDEAISKALAPYLEGFPEFVEVAPMSNAQAVTLTEQVEYISALREKKRA